MGFFSWLFSRFRVARPPERHSAGRFFPPASVRRAQLDVADLDLPRGVITLITGEYRACATVTGWPVHARSSDRALAFLQRFAQTLNTLPGNVVLLSRSRPGGLERYAAERRVRASGEADPARRRLLTDQSAHALERMRQGAVRATDNYLVVRGASAEKTLGLLRDTIERFALAEVQAKQITDGRLVRLIAESWRPALVEHFVQDFTGPDGEAFATLVYSPGAARITTPRYRPAVPPERPRANDHHPLPGSNGKALPR